MKKLNVITETYEIKGFKRERVMFILEGESYPRKGYDFSPNGNFKKYVDNRIEEIVKSNKYLVLFMTK